MMTCVLTKDVPGFPAKRQFATLHLFQRTWGGGKLVGSAHVSTQSFQSGIVSAVSACVAGLHVTPHVLGGHRCHVSCSKRQLGPRFNGIESLIFRFLFLGSKAKSPTQPFLLLHRAPKSLEKTREFSAQIASDFRSN